MNLRKTERGFGIIDFKDLYNHNCSLQESSLATDDAIWFGIDDQELTVFEENMGKYVVTKLPHNWKTNGRMHLSRTQVAELLPYLQSFVETGELKK